MSSSTIPDPLGLGGGREAETSTGEAYVASLDHDPAALAWARAKVLEVTGGWRALAARLAAGDMDANAEKWRRVAQIAENALIGGRTDQLAVFDERHGIQEDACSPSRSS
jgi:hypothetical protein